MYLLDPDTGLLEPCLVLELRQGRQSGAAARQRHSQGQALARGQGQGLVNGEEASVEAACGGILEAVDLGAREGGSTRHGGVEERGSTRSLGDGERGSVRSLAGERSSIAWRDCSYRERGSSSLPGERSSTRRSTFQPWRDEVSLAPLISAHGTHSSLT